MRSRLRRFCLVLVACTFAATAAAAGDSGHLVTQTNIGGARLGLRATEYTRIFGAKPFTTRYADGTSRLSFTRAEVDVYLDRRGAGVAISTLAREYATSSGAAPCGALADLRRSYAKTIKPHSLRPHGTVAVYSVGHLWFAAYGNRIGSVTLTAGSPTPSFFVNMAQCGQGED